MHRSTPSLRRLLLLLLAVATLSVAALPAGAQATCGCVQFARAFKHSPKAKTRLYRRLRYYGLSTTERRGIRRGIYDQAKGGYTDPSFCNRSPAHRKACKAAIACVVTAAPTYLAARAGGASRDEAASNAVGACVAGVLTVFLVA